MPLPPLIEIVPPTRQAPVRVTIPGSKSITNRALILAALANGRTTLRGALWSVSQGRAGGRGRALGGSDGLGNDQGRSPACAAAAV